MNPVHEKLLGKLAQFNQDQYLVTENYSAVGFNQAIDVIVVSVKGIFVIQTVDAVGNISGNDSDESWSAEDYMNPQNPKVVFENPTRIVNEYVDYISGRLAPKEIKIPIMPMIVFSDDSMVMGIQSTMEKAQIRDLSYILGKHSTVSLKEYTLEDIKRIIGNVNQLDASKTYDKGAVAENPQSETPKVVEHSVKEIPNLHDKEYAMDENRNKEDLTPQKEAVVSKVYEDISMEAIDAQDGQSAKYVDMAKVSEEYSNIKNTRNAPAEAPYVEHKVDRKKEMQETASIRKSKLIVVIVAWFVVGSFLGGFGALLLIGVEFFAYTIPAMNFKEWVMKVVAVSMIAAIVFGIIGL